MPARAARDFAVVPSLEEASLRSDAAAARRVSATRTHITEDVLDGQEQPATAACLELDSILPRMPATRDMDAGHVRALAESIRALGLIEPIVVDSKHRLLAGAHRLEALKLLRARDPELFTSRFPRGIAVQRMEFSCDAAPARALEIEIAENEHRRNYTGAQVRELARRLRDAGYRDSVGRPKDGEKALGPALAVVIGRSMKTIRKMLAELERNAPDASTVRARRPSLSSFLSALARYRPILPDSLTPQLEALVQATEAEIRARRRGTACRRHEPTSA